MNGQRYVDEVVEFLILHSSKFHFSTKVIPGRISQDRFQAANVNKLPARFPDSFANIYGTVIKLANPPLILEVLKHKL